MPATKIRKRKVLKYTKLHKLLADCLEDLRWVEKSKKYVVDMDSYVLQEDGAPCQVCLAGACLVRRCSEVPEEVECVCPYDFDPETASAMEAADALRTGDVGYASDLLYDGDVLDLDRDIIDYHEDRKLWWKEMRQLLRDIRAANA